MGGRFLDACVSWIWGWVASVVWWWFGVSWLFCDLFWRFWLRGLGLVEVWCFLVCVIERGCRGIVSAWRLVGWLVLGWFCCLGVVWAVVAGCYVGFLDVTLIDFGLWVLF